MDSKKDNNSSNGQQKKSAGGGSSKLPPMPQNVTNPQVETVSPATRLLEKRRLMYEKQEEYEAKKK